MLFSLLITLLVLSFNLITIVIIKVKVIANVLNLTCIIVKTQTLLAKIFSYDEQILKWKT